MHNLLFQQNINGIAEEYSLKLLIYFGSYGTSLYNNDSDIDIAFLSVDSLSESEKIKLLEDLIKIHRKSEIDLVDLRTAEPILRYEIAVNGRVLYEKEEYLFERYRLFYIKRFYELKPVIEEELKNISMAIREVLEDA